MINLDKCSGSSNVLSPKIRCSEKKTKGINVKAFNMIKKKMKLKP